MFLCICLLYFHLFTCSWVIVYLHSRLLPVIANNYLLDGRALLINFERRCLLHHFNFKAPVHEIKFSPCGKYIAVTHGKQIHVWRTPG